MNTTTETQQTVQFVGGPGLDPTENNSNPQGGTPAATPPQAAATPIFVGGRRFDSMEELATYTNELQNSKTKQDAIASFQPEAAKAANAPKPSDLMFQDPDAFYAAVKEESVNEALQIFNKQTNEKELWNQFYTSNKDLADHKEFVEFAFTKRKKEYENLPVADGLAKIAVEVRSLISKARGSVQNGKELPSGPAVVAGASNGNTVTQVPVIRVDQDFVSQVRRMQKRGK